MSICEGDRQSEPTGASAVLGEMLRGAPNASPAVRDVAGAVTALTRDPGAGELITGIGITESITVLARVRHVLDAELGRRLRIADVSDCTPTGAQFALNAEGWTRQAAATLRAAAATADRHPNLARLWTTGRVSADVVAAIGRGTRTLTDDQTRELVALLVPRLPQLSLPDVRRLVALAVDALRPEDRDAKEQSDHDARHLALSTYRGVVTFKGQLSATDGAAFRAAIGALVDSLRASGDCLTQGQRQADALSALVASASVTDTLPQSRAGLPVAATITIGLAEAERVAAGNPRPAAETLQQALDQLEGVSRFGVVGDPDCTLGDAATRFALCCGALTGMLVHRPSDASHDLPSHDHDGPDDRCEGPWQTRAVAAALGATRLEPLAVGRSFRFATAAQRKALALRDGGCVIPGCGRPIEECDAHHVQDWALGGSTDLSNLAAVCWVHHHQVDLQRWTLTRNPDPHGPHWQVTPTPRAVWRQRPAA